ncbi:MAG: hypothetical protein GXC73_07755 [Chitinophagaceae bacterium]|nr:hypothetical protein [Chitinophagaceae bacterium]
MKTLLLVIVAFVAVTAIPCGIMMMIKPDGSLLQLDMQLIRHSTFPNYFVPGFALTFLAGGVNLVAVLQLFRKKQKALNWAIAGGLMIVAFEVVQILVIQTYSWFQTVYLLCGFFMILIALQLKHKELI